MVKFSELFTSYNFITEDYSANFSCQSFTINRIDTSNNSVTATLPSTPKNQDEICFLDAVGSDPNNPTGFGKNPLTIDGLGATIQGYNETLILNGENSSVSLIYNATDNNWNISNASLGGFSSSSSYTASLSVNVRELMTSDRTYYVSPSGDNNNDGLTNSSAFLTIQKAIDAVASKDWGGVYIPTIQLMDGNYSLSSGLVLKSVVEADRVIIQGNNVDPSQVVIEVTNGGEYAFKAININSIYEIKNLKVTLNQASNASLPTGAIITNNSFVETNQIIVEGLEVLSNPVQWFRSENNGIFFVPNGGNIEFLPFLSGTPSQYAGFVSASAILRLQGVNFTLTNTPNFSVFIIISRVSSGYVNGFTTVGSATGIKFEVSNVSNLFTGGNSANLPGNTAGVVVNLGNVE